MPQLWPFMYFCQRPLLLSHLDRDRNAMCPRISHHIVNLCLANTATVAATLEQNSPARLVGDGDGKRIQCYSCSGDVQSTMLQLLKRDKRLRLFWI